MKLNIFLLMAYLLVFGLVLVIAIVDNLRSVPIINIGLSAFTINSIVMVISILGMFKSIWHIVRA